MFLLNALFCQKWAVLARDGLRLLKMNRFNSIQFYYQQFNSQFNTYIAHFNSIQFQFTQYVTIQFTIQFESITLWINSNSILQKLGLKAELFHSLRIECPSLITERTMSGKTYFIVFKNSRREAALILMKYLNISITICKFSVSFQFQGVDRYFSFKKTLIFIIYAAIVNWSPQNSLIF